MNEVGLASPGISGTVSRLLTLMGGKSARDEGDVAPQPRHSRIPFARDMSQRELMDRISSFLLENALPVTPSNLVRAHAAFSGANLHLARKILEREAEGTPIGQGWLDAASPEADGGDTDEREEVDRLASQLGESIATFSHTARNARTAAAHYKDALTEHAERIDSSQATNNLLTSMADLTRVLLDRTKQAEEEMRRSEREAAGLRKNLEKAQRAAEFDHLTGLPNRRAFEGLLERHYREAQSAIEPLSVAFCDIDHFKPVNDTHGHETGDRVIQMIAQTLARASNDNCHVARHGGDEFVLLFRGLTTDEARLRLDEVRETLANRSFVNRASDAPIGRITFSGGVSNVFAYANPREALRAADEALYRAKDGGRNRIELAEATS